MERVASAFFFPHASGAAKTAFRIHRPPMTDLLYRCECSN
jgi:hypothetical protein